MMSDHALKIDSPAFDKASASSTSQLDRVSAAFALSAAVTVVFNTLLAWVKDAYEPLNTFMAHLSGHHWTTHGIADVLLFVVLGFVFLSSGVASRMNPPRLVATLVGAVVAAGLGLAAWFVLF
ncbi:MAG: hypothetical protein ABI409_01545 [Ramlibacter sp.]